MRTLLSTLLLVAIAASASPERPEHGGKVLLFGNLHAHSGLSDDLKDDTGELMPSVAFEYARNHGLDFLAITDHHKADDAPGTRFQMEPSEYRTHLYDVARRYNADHKGRFVAIPGFEWGNTATGNHVNLLGATALPPSTIRNKDYDEVYTWARDNCKFVQFNHPKSWSYKTNRNKSVGNFGEKLYQTPKEFAERVDGVLKTVSIITTVRGGHISGRYRDSEEKTHRDAQWEGYYQRFLNLGFHISPAANQDTHGPNWGTVTAARTAAWADAVTYRDLMDAFRANRVYATEDDEMVVVFLAEYGGKSYWMGETVSIDGDEDEITFKVAVWQAEGSDGDSTDEGPYTIEVIRDSDGVGGQAASLWDTVSDVHTKQVVEIPAQAQGGQYFYLRVMEQEGKDNLVGEGEDALENDTGELGGDGLRDDPNDTAWTSPIWIQGSQATYYWSVRSRKKLYHQKDCWAVSRIGATNLRSGAPPEGWQKHGCKPRTGVN